MMSNLVENTLQSLLNHLKDATKNYAGEVLDRKTWEQVAVSINCCLQEWAHNANRMLDIRVKTGDTMLIETADSSISILVTVRHQKIRINVIENEY